MFGVDYTDGNAAPRALARAGVKFVCRYLVPDTHSLRWKRIGRAELDRLKAASMPVAFVFETSANRTLSGRAAGIEDAKAAVACLVELGLETPTIEGGGGAGSGVYFAVDFDAQPDQQRAIDAYLRGAASVLGHDRVGVYAGYRVVKAALDGGACELAWQTYAWSGGLVDKRANLYQYSNGHTLAGVSCDYDRALRKDFGQFPRPQIRRLDPLWELVARHHVIWKARLKRVPGWAKQLKSTIAGARFRKLR